MSEKLMLINADQPEECRAVILEDGNIENFIIEHSGHEQIKGNIYLGVINRVEPSIEAAFVDIGTKKFGFLPFKDVLKESYLQTGEKKARVRIQDVLVRGQKILVQVAKEGRDAKGPSLTNSISLPGRFLVLMNGAEGSAVSRKIEDEAERKKLKTIISSFDLPDNLGLIIRTAGLGRSKSELHKDYLMLLKFWETIQKSIEDEAQAPPYMIYQEANMVVRTVRDHFTQDMKEIVVDNPESYKALRNFFRMVMPRSRNLVRLYQDPKPLFAQHNIEAQIESIYERKVALPSGGSVVIDIGEAMVSIDVNSGKTTGASALEETATRTNLEAATEIARQLRLRDLGGLIVIDFIDMFQKRNKANVEKQMKKSCKTDKARINISRISKFGLLEMSRQRISPPVKEGVFEPCGLCKGSGHVRSVGSIVLNVLRKIGGLVAVGNIRELHLEVSPEIGAYIFNEKSKYLTALQEKEKFVLKLSIKPGITYDEFKYTVLTRVDTEKDAVVETAGREASSNVRPIREARPRGDQRGETKVAPKVEVETAKKEEGEEKTEPRKRTGPRRSRDEGGRKRFTRRGSGGRGRRPARLHGSGNRNPKAAPGNEASPVATGTETPDSASIRVNTPAVQSTTVAPPPPAQIERNGNQAAPAVSRGADTQTETGGQ